MANRRDFLKILTGASMAALLPLPSFSTPFQKRKRDKWGELLPVREFGNTGEKVTMLGVGGFHIGKMDDYEAQKTIETAIEGGIRFVDSAESYQSGGSERNIGKFLPKYRDEVYLMTKTRAKDAKTARQHLEGSLKRLKTDYLDLWQIHDIKSAEDVNSRIESGVLDVLLQAQQEGKVRHIGFTGHTRPNAHTHIMDKSNDLQTCQIPVNLLDPGYNSFIKNVLPTLVNKKIGVIAMKTLAGGGFFGGGFEGNYRQKNQVVDFITIKDAMHFVWSLPIDVLVTGADNAEMLQEKINLANSFTSLSDSERDTLIAKVAHMAGKTVEYYKASV